MIYTKHPYYSLSPSYFFMFIFLCCFVILRVWGGAWWFYEYTDRWMGEWINGCVNGGLVDGFMNGCMGWMVGWWLDGRMEGRRRPGLSVSRAAFWHVFRKESTKNHGKFRQKTLTSHVKFNRIKRCNHSVCVGNSTLLPHPNHPHQLCPSNNHENPFSKQQNLNLSKALSFGFESNSQWKFTALLYVLTLLHI